MASPALSPLSTFAKIACAGEVQQKKGGTERRAKKQENKRTISPCRPPRSPFPAAGLFVIISPWGREEGDEEEEGGVRKQGLLCSIFRGSLRRRASRK